MAAGLVASLGRPGGNLTGVTAATGREPYDKRFRLLEELAPKSFRVAFLGRRSARETYRIGAKDGATVLVAVKSAWETYRIGAKDGATVLVAVKDGYHGGRFVGRTMTGYLPQDGWTEAGCPLVG